MFFICNYISRTPSDRKRGIETLSFVQDIKMWLGLSRDFPSPLSRFPFEGKQYSIQLVGEFYFLSQGGDTFRKMSGKFSNRVR